MSELVYHYCSIDAFKAIVESRSLWASSFRYMNDASEAIDTQRSLGENHDLVLERFLGAGCYKTIREALDHVSGMAEIEFFQVSFCKRPDKLSQWRYYADSGRGVALGFRRSAFSKFLLKDVFYGNLEERLVTTCQTLANAFGADDDDFRKQCVRSFIELVGLAKSSAFEEEDECRLIHFYDRNDHDINIRFRRSGKFIAPYIEIDLADLWHQCLAEVWLGPMIAERSMYESVRFFLNRNGLKDYSISESRAPFRHL